MARKHSDTAVLDAPPPQTNGEAVDPAAPIPVTDAPPVIPSDPPPARKPRKARDPNAVRPMYQIQGMDRYSGAMRILLTAPTKGQARKLLPQAAQVGGELQGSPVIVQCRIVS